MHTFTSAGQFTVLVTVSDDDGGIAAKSFLVNVQPNTNGSACLPVIDFDTDSLGNSLGNSVTTGTAISELWSNWGVRVTTNDPAKYPLAVVNNTSSGTRDSLLLIADKASTTQPTAYTGGGTINFYFDATVRVDQLRLFKIPRGQFATVRWYDRASTKTGEAKVTGDDNKLYQTVTANASGVRRLEIQFTGSGRDQRYHLLQ